MKKLIILFLLVFNALLYSEIVIEHNPPYVAYRNSDMDLNISIEGERQRVTSLDIFYRERGEVAFKNQSLPIEYNDNGEYIALIPVSQYARGLEYYIEVRTNDDELITYPSEQATLNPVLVQIIDREISNDFVILNDMREFEEGADLSLSISIFNIRGEIDYKTIKFFVNGRNQTKKLLITPTLLVYNIKNVAESFEYRIIANKFDGTRLDSGLQAISVKKKMFTYELPYNLRGNVNYKGNTNSYDYDSANNTSEASTNTHSAILSINGNNSYSRVNSRIYLSSLENSDRQSVNRYSFDARVPHFELYLGDKSPYLSEFTTNNLNIRGFGSKLFFKYFLLESYWGSSRREISTKENNGNYIPGTFQRQSGAFRMAFGNENAFQLGFNLAKNKDRIASLDYDDYYIPQINSKEEEEVNQIINPMDNLVFSTDVKLSSPNKLFNFGAEMAISAYNSNIIDGAISEEDLENDVGGDLPFDPESIDGFFVINKNTEPLSLTSSNLAYKLYSSLYIAGNLFSVNYSRVGSSFNSLSARNINSDTYNFTFADNINFHNMVFVDFSYSRVSDNLSENLATTNEYSNYQLNSVFRKEKFPVLRVNLNRGRTSISNNDVFEMNENDSLTDSIDEAQEYRTTSYGMGIGYDFDRVPLVPFSLDFDYQNSLDEDDLRDMYEFKNHSFYAKYKSKLTLFPLTTELSYNFTKSEGFTLVNVSMNEAKEESYFLNSEEWNRTSLRVKLKYDIEAIKLIPFIDYRFTNNESQLNSADDNSYTSSSVGLSYYPLQLTSITTSITIKDRDYETEDSGYSALNWYLNIVQKF